MTTTPTPKQIFEIAIPNQWAEGTYYSVPGIPGLEAKILHGKIQDTSKSYIIVRKPCKVHVVQDETGEIVFTYSGYNKARAEMPDGIWEWA